MPESVASIRDLMNGNSGVLENAPKNASIGNLLTNTNEGSSMPAAPQIDDYKILRDKENLAEYTSSLSGPEKQPSGGKQRRSNCHTIRKRQRSSSDEYYSDDRQEKPLPRQPIKKLFVQDLKQSPSTSILDSPGTSFKQTEIPVDSLANSRKSKNSTHSENDTQFSEESDVETSTPIGPKNMIHLSFNSEGNVILKSVLQTLQEIKTITEDSHYLLKENNLLPKNLSSNKSEVGLPVDFPALPLSTKEELQSLIHLCNTNGTSTLVKYFKTIGGITAHQMVQNI